MTDNMDEFIAVRLESGPADCPSLTMEWMNLHRIRYTETGYHYMLQKMNRHMKSLERYGIVRYTGKVVSSNIRAKIWELDINDEE